MDHYSTLGISKTASQDEIKKAYRKLASQHHPDKGGNTATFQKIEEAYRILSDPNTRAQYDNPQPQFNGFGFNPHAGNGPDMNDFFSHIFGGGGNPFGGHGNPFGGGGNPFNQHQNKQVFRTAINITLEQAYHGSSQTLQLQTPTGIKVVNIEIPKGAHRPEFASIRYDNIIDNAALMVEFRIMQNPKYECRNNDLYSIHKISVLDLIIGTTFNFVTMSGKEFQVKVPAKTQPQVHMKIAGQGMPMHGSSFGDQYILLSAVVPDKIHPEIINAISNFK